jgi:hypothetical protein
MKKSILTTLALALGLYVFAQQCTINLHYSGANSTESLAQFLNNPDKPALYNLCPAAKEALLMYTAFENGVVAGFTSEANDEIDRLYATNFTEIMSAIVNCPVVLRESPERHSYIAIYTGNNSDPTGLCDWHPKRAPNKNTGCCDYKGKGCCDIIAHPSLLTGCQ